MAKKKKEMPIHPLFQYVLIRVDEKPSKRGSVYIPESTERRMETGIVLAVGEGRITSEGVVIEPRVKPGDRIVFRDVAIKKNGNWVCPNEVDLEDDKVYFVEDVDIMGIIK